MKGSFIIALIFALPNLVLTACTIEESTFPYYLGGSTQNTILNVIDVNQATGYMAVAGYTSDQEVLTGSLSGTADFNPFIMLMDRPNVIQWKIYFSELNEQVTALKFNPDGTLLVAVLENQPLRLFFFSTLDGSKVGSLQQDTPSMVRASRFCRGNCLQFSTLSNTLYLAMQGTYADTVEGDASFCCYDSGDFSATCCDYRLWEVVKLDFSVVPGSFALNIDQDFVYDRESTANTLQVVSDGTTEQLYVAGYTTRAGLSTPREQRPTITQHLASDLTRYWGIQSNLGSLANYYQMMEMHVYIDTTTFIASCSHDKVAAGYLGLHFFKQLTANALPTQERSLLFGLSTDYNLCFSVYATKQSSSVHNFYALATLANDQTPIVIQLTITVGGGYTVAYTAMDIVVDPMSFSFQAGTFYSTRPYIVGQSAQTLSASPTSMTGVSAGFLDSLDVSISCNGHQASYSGPTITTNPSSFASVTIIPVDKGASENSWITTTLDTLRILSKAELLKAYSNSCSKTGPSVVLATNKVLAPTNIGFSSISLLVGPDPVVKTFDDFSVFICASGGGAGTLTRTLTSTPADLVTKGAVSLTLSTNNKLVLTIQTSDSTLIGTFELLIKAAIPSGEFATLTIPTVTISSDCKAAGIAVTFGGTPLMGTTRLDITNASNPVASNGFISLNALQVPIVPAYSLKPFDCGYSLSYTISLSNGLAVPSFITFNSLTSSFEVALSNAQVGVYQVRLMAKLNDSKGTFDDTVVWTLYITSTGAGSVKVVKNHAPYFITAIKQPILAALNVVTDYTLPDSRDADAGDTVLVNLKTSQPFITLSGKVLRVQASKASHLGQWECEVTLSDGHPAGQTTYLVAVHVDKVSNNETVPPPVPPPPAPIKKVDPSLTARITQITLKGEVTVRFNRPLIVFPNATEILSQSQVLKLAITSNQTVQAILESWSVTEMLPQSIHIQLHFANPEAVGQSSMDIRESLKITILDNQYFLDAATYLAIKQDTVVVRVLPPQVEPTNAAVQAMESVAGILSGTIMSMMFANLAISMVLTSSTQIIWGLINSLQVLIHLPLAQFQFPANVRLFCQIMAEAANFDFLPSGTFNDWLLSRDPDREEDYPEGPFNQRFSDMGYDSVNFLDTLSDMFYYELFFLASTILVLLGRALIRKGTGLVRKLTGRKGDGEQLEGGDSIVEHTIDNTREDEVVEVGAGKRCQKLRKLGMWFKEKFIPGMYQKVVWSAVLRIFLEGYFEVCVATLPAVSVMTLSDTSVTSRQRACQVLAIIHLAFIVLGYPLFVICFFLLRKNTLSTEHAQHRFGALFEELNFSDSRALSYHVLFLFRRLLLIVQVTFIEHQFANFLILLSTSSVVLVYVMKVRPFTESLMNRLEFFNEFIVLLCSVYHTLMFSDLSAIAEQPYSFQLIPGWSFIGLILCVMIPVNVISIAAFNIRLMWLKRHKARLSLRNALRKMLFMRLVKKNAVQAMIRRKSIQTLRENAVSLTVSNLVTESERRGNLEEFTYRTNIYERDLKIDYLKVPEPTRRNQLENFDMEKIEEEKYEYPLQSQRTVDEQTLQAYSNSAIPQMISVTRLVNTPIENSSSRNSARYNTSEQGGSKLTALHTIDRKGSNTERGQHIDTLQSPRMVMAGSKSVASSLQSSKDSQVSPNFKQAPPPSNGSIGLEDI